MEAQINKDERIEIRVSSHEKHIFQKTQKPNGEKSFTSFIVRIVKKEAKEIVARNSQIITSEKDKEIFFEEVYGDKNQIRT